MEFINTIWSALTTENERLCNILVQPFAFIEIMVSMFLFIAFLNLKPTTKQKYIYVITLGIFAILNNIICSGIYTFIVNLIFNFICIRIIFKTSIIQTLLAQILPILFQAFFEYIITNIIFNAFNVGSEILYIPIFRLVIILTIYSTMFLVSILIRKINFNLDFIHTNIKSKNKFLLFTTILGLLSIISQVFITYFYSSQLPTIFSILNWLLTLSYIFVNIYSIYKSNKLQTTSLELENAELYNRTLSILHDNIRGFKHDFNNIVSTMGGFIYNDDVEGLKKYYSQLQADCIKVNNLAVLNPNIINNPGVYSLLTDKYYKARELDIDFNIEFFLDLNELNMSIYEFTRVLGILLDNAIEAANDCDEKIINVAFRKFNSKHCQIVSIENTYTNKDVDIDRIFNKGISGKEDHSGLGLWEVRQILKKHNNLNLFTTKNEKFFKQQLEIYY